MNRRFSRLAALIALVCAAAACGSGGDGSNALLGNLPVADDCSVAAKNQFVEDTMRDIYFWVDQLPAALDAGQFDSPEEVLEALRFNPDDIFSNIQDRATSDAFFSNSQFIGLGIGLLLDADDTLKVTQAFAASPAAQAGLDRGYRILAIDGRTVADMIAAGDDPLAQFGEREVGITVSLTYADLAGTQATAQVTKAIVTIEPVTATAVLSNGGRVTGYLAFRNFVEPSFDALEVAFAQFAAEGVEDLVVDLRYNGGGLIAVAEELGGLIGGTITAGEVFAERTHNTANSFRNVTTLFADVTNALNLQRVVFITTAQTASASEMVMNGLAPFLQVKSVGERSFGKPVGSYLFDFCDKTLSPISFSNRNANGFGDYFDGLPADCAAPDDLTHALGDPLEASLSEALVVLATDQCSIQTAATKQAWRAGAQKRRARQARVDSWQQLTNAY